MQKLQKLQKLQNPALCGQFSPKNEKQKYESCKTPPSQGNFPNKQKKQIIEKMQNSALPRWFFDTVDTVHIVYAVDMDYIVDMVYTVYTIQTAWHCLNSIMYAYIYILHTW